jgi:hypothetical protein
MFEKFGKMTFDDLNRTAEGLKMEGDVESLVLLAEENGLEKEDAEDYADGHAGQSTGSSYGKD